MSSINGLDTWSVISGAIGVLTILPLICAFIWNQHPENKLAQLDSTLKETESLLRSVVEEGLLDPEHHVVHFEQYLKKFRRKTEQFRDETYMASNDWRKLLGAWYNGLSKRITLLCKRVKAVRANICETSANARMQLMEQSCEEIIPAPRGWRAKVASLWQHAVSLVCKSAPRDIPDAPASVPLAALTSNESVPLAGGTTTSTAEAAVSTHDSPQPESAPPRGKGSAHDLSQKFGRTTRTASRTHDLHVLTRAIRRVDRELAAQGVTNALLTQLVQGTHRQWSPASSKARPPRRPRKQDSVSHRPIRLETLQGASGSGVDSDDDSSGEDTVCED